jgi:hypothetical protein
MSKTKEFAKIVSELEAIFNRCEKHDITISIIASDGESDLVSAYGTIHNIADLIINSEDSVILKAAKIAVATILVESIVIEK